jgi:hypothetical protein
MTTKLSLTHVFPCTPAELFDLLDDPALEELQGRESNMERVVVERRTNPDGTRFKRVRCRPNRALPGFLRPLIGAEGLVFFQTAEADPARSLLRWSVEVPAFGQRMKVAGTTRVAPHPAGCERTIEGAVTVDVRLVGGQIERFVAEDVQKSYEKTARAMAAFIADRRAR